MKMRKSILVCISILLIVTIGSSKSMAQEDIGNEYRITLFPSHKVTDKIGGFGYLGYVWNPEKDYQTYYLGWPCATYTPKTWMQIWGGLIGAYTDNEKNPTILSFARLPGRSFFCPIS